MRKILLATLVLSFAASSAMAATRNQSRAAIPAAAAQAYAAANNGNAVVKEGVVRGTDPDPYVRFELNREVDPANTNGQ
jgi:lipopolysaccharide export system protein LptA